MLLVTAEGTQSPHSCQLSIAASLPLPGFRHWVLDAILLPHGQALNKHVSSAAETTTTAFQQNHSLPQQHLLSSQLLSQTSSTPQLAHAATHNETNMLPGGAADFTCFLAVGLMDNSVEVWSLPPLNSFAKGLRPQVPLANNTAESPIRLARFESEHRMLLYSMVLRYHHAPQYQSHASAAMPMCGTIWVVSGSVCNQAFVWKLPNISAALSEQYEAAESSHNCSSSCNSAGCDRVDAIEAPLQLQGQQQETAACMPDPAMHVLPAATMVKPLYRCKGHEGSIHRIQWSSDGGSFMTMSDDRSARVWRLPKLQAQPRAGMCDNVCDQQLVIELDQHGLQPNMFDTAFPNSNTTSKPSSSTTSKHSSSSSTTSKRSSSTTSKCSSSSSSSICSTSTTTTTSNSNNIHDSPHEVDLQPSMVLWGHTARIWDGQLHGGFAITASEDCTCCLWDVSSGRQLARIQVCYLQGLDCVAAVDTCVQLAAACIQAQGMQSVLLLAQWLQSAMHHNSMWSICRPWAPSWALLWLHATSGVHRRFAIVAPMLSCHQSYYM